VFSAGQAVTKEQSFLQERQGLKESVFYRRGWKRMQEFSAGEAGKRGQSFLRERRVYCK
jgi:hypothetical protein